MSECPVGTKIRAVVEGTVDEIKKWGVKLDTGASIVTADGRITIEVVEPAPHRPAHWPPRDGDVWEAIHAGCKPHVLHRIGGAWQYSEGGPVARWSAAPDVQWRRLYPPCTCHSAEGAPR